MRRKITIENINFKYSLIKDPSKTSSLEYIKQQIKTVSFLVVLTIVSVF